MRDGHPDDDQLADLASDVLPLAEARAVEAHVLACERCSLLLADAERIRGLLLAGDPGPMPADVWARIEAALGAAGAGTGPGPASASEPAPVPLHTERVHGPAAWDDDADPFDAAGSTAFDTRRPGGSRGRGAVPSRREARSGGRRPGRRIAATVVGVAAAAVIGVVAVNALRAESGGSGASGGTAAIGAESDSSAAAAAGGAAGSGSPAVRYERTGTAYTSAGLARQAQALTRTPPADAAPAATPGAGPAPVASAPAASAPVARPPGSADGRAPRHLAQVAPDPTATDISNPANLDGCLAALKTSPDRLVAVDLATYQDREAAVLVLHAVDGGYEVFVVERSCSASDDHSLAYTALKG